MEGQTAQLPDIYQTIPAATDYSPTAKSNSTELRPMEGQTVQLPDLYQTIPTAMDPKPSNLLSRLPIEIRSSIFEPFLVRFDAEQALKEYRAETSRILLALRAGCRAGASWLLSAEYRAARLERKNGCKELCRTKRITPNLLIALRCVPDLYSNALEIYYRINAFEVSPYSEILGADSAIGALHQRHLSTTTLGSIKKLDVMTNELSWNGKFNGRFLPHVPDVLRKFDLSRIIPAFTHLEVLRVRVDRLNWSDCSIFLGMVSKLKSLERVELDIVVLCQPCAWRPDYKELLVDGMNDIWAINAKLLQVDGGPGSWFKGQTFFWQSRRGHTLDWSWEIYRKWLRTRMIETRYGSHDAPIYYQFGWAYSRNYEWDNDGESWDLWQSQAPWWFYSGTKKPDSESRSVLEPLFADIV